MAVLITADLHLSDNPRDAYRFEFLKRLQSVVEKQDITCLAILGDLTEQKDYHSAALVNRVVAELSILTECVPIVIVRGNHDGTDPSCPFFLFAKEISGISWVVYPTDASLLPRKRLASLGRTLLLPHTTNPERDWKKFNLKDYEFILTHNTFSGARGDSGHVLRGININLIPEDATVISGDVHVPQKLGPVTYVGAPYTIDFGDSYKPRYFIIDHESIRSIASKGPQKKLLEISHVNELSNFDLVPGDILKVNVNLPQSEYALWPKITDEIRQWGKGNSYIVHTIKPIVDVAKTKKSRQHSSKGEISDAEILDRYGSSRSVDAKTLKVGHSFVEKV